MGFKIQFLGAAGTVTGSRYLVSTQGKNILVDCGLFQGVKSLRLKNWDDFPIPAKSIDAIILTHAHIDHSGYIPKLVKNGFRGKIYCTPATKDTCRILLADCGHLQEEEAQYLNRVGRSKHKPAEPLFTVRDAQTAMEYFQTIDFKQKTAIDEHFSFEFLYVGHILGAASVVLNVDGRKIGFTGDVGRPYDRIFRSPEVLPKLDYLITESTYGDRIHSPVDPLLELENVVNETYRKGGVLLIPAFAVGRVQSLIYYLYLLRKQNRIPQVPIYLNSPMAIDFEGVFSKYKNLHKLTEEECREIKGLITYVHTVEDSKDLNLKHGPMVVISASGMLTGGRILHHMKAFAPFPENTILLAGFQAAGTRGEALQHGKKEIKIHGEYIPIQANVVTLENISAHADYKEMIEWFKKSNLKPIKVFVTHGESSAADEFRRRLTEVFGWDCVVPDLVESYELT